MSFVANNKRIAKNTLLLYIRMFVMMGISMYASRVALKILGIEDYGLYNVVGGIVAMLVFINSAMANATQRFITYALGKNNLHESRKVFCSAVNTHFIISCVILLLAETIGLWFLNNKIVIPEGRVNACFWVYQLSVFTCIVSVMSVPYNATIIAHEKMSAFAYISFLEACLKLLVIFLLDIFEFDKLILYAVFLAIIQFAIRMVYGIYCRFSFQETTYKFSFDAKLMKKMTSFAGWSLWGNLASVAGAQGVNIMLNMLFGPAVNASRALAVQVQMTISGFCVNFQTAMNPQITKTYASNNLDSHYRLILASSKFSAILLMFASVPLILETSQILQLWLGDVPSFASIFLKLVLITAIIDCISNPLSISMQATGNVKFFQIFVGSTLLMILPFGWCAARLFNSPVAFFLVGIFISCCALFVRLIFLKKYVNLDVFKFFKVVLLPLLIVFVAMIIPSMLLKRFMEISLLRCFVVSASSWVLGGITVCLVALSKEETLMIKNFFSKIVRKIHG